MGITLDGKLVVAISSRALFDFEEENQVFEQTDDTAYMRLQLERLDIPAKPGVAFSRLFWLLHWRSWFGLMASYYHFQPSLFLSAYSSIF